VNEIVADFQGEIDLLSLHIDSIDYLRSPRTDSLWSAGSCRKRPGWRKYGTNSLFLRDGVGNESFPGVPLEAGFQHPRAQRDIKERSEHSKHLPWIDV